MLVTEPPALPLRFSRNAPLLVASIAFCATGGGAFTWLMLHSIAVNYLRDSAEFLEKF